MTITREQLEHWLASASEAEKLEFKEAKISFSRDKVLTYVTALANEGGGHLVLGVSDRRPRTVVGTRAYSNESELNEIKKFLFDELNLRVHVEELAHPDGRVLVFLIPSRPIGTPLHVKGTYLMR